MKFLAPLGYFRFLCSFKHLFPHLEYFRAECKFQILNSQINVDFEKNTRFEVFKSHRVDLNLKIDRIWSNLIHNVHIQCSSKKPSFFCFRLLELGNLAKIHTLKQADVPRSFRHWASKVKSFPGSTLARDSVSWGLLYMHVAVSPLK